MKKGLCLLAAFFLVLSCAQPAFAADQIAAPSAADAMLLINSGLGKNFNKLQDISGSLSLGDRTLLYQSYHKRSTEALLLNLFIGLFGVGGIGSFVQGDTTGGTIAICGQFGGEIVLGAGLALMNYSNMDMNMPGNVAAATLIVIGGAATLGFWIFGIMRPLQYANSYNQMLKSALNLNPLPFSLKVEPMILAGNGIRDPGYGAQVGLAW